VNPLDDEIGRLAEADKERQEFNRFLRSGPLPSGQVDTLKAAPPPSPLDYATNAVTGVLNKVLPTDKYGRQFREERAREALDLFTPAGAAEGLYQAGQSLGRGEYGAAALEIPLAVLASLPGAAFTRRGQDAIERATRVARDTEGFGRGIDTAPLETLSQNVSPAQEFYLALKRAQEAHPYGSSVTLNDPEYYEQVRTFLNEPKNAGLAVTPEGDIVSVFRHPEAPKTSITELMPQAIEAGGTTLDAFHTQLPYIYSTYGFRPTSRLAFDPEYAPTGWDYEKYKKYQEGRPDVIFMAYRPDLADDDIAKQIANLPYSASYEDAKAAQREALNARIQENAPQVSDSRGGLRLAGEENYEGARPSEAGGVSGGFGPYAGQAGAEAAGAAGTLGRDIPGYRNRVPLTEPPTGEEGQVTLYHWGLEPGLTELDPSYWGRNVPILSREERNRIGDAPGRTYFGISPGEEGGYRVESGLGPYKYQAEMPLSDLYPMELDPMNLRPLEGPNAKTRYEKAIRDAGYSGYWMQHPSLGMVAVAFKPTRVREGKRRGGSIDRAVKLARQHHNAAFNNLMLKSATRNKTYSTPRGRSPHGR